ncbi:hypothetical protein GCM10020331_093940 [Ectobacillus funiculus]
MLFDHLKSENVEVNYKHSVKDIKRASDGSWEVKVHDIDSGKIEYHSAKFVFIGGGGRKSAFTTKKLVFLNRKNIGGFPVSGLFMVCNNPEVAAQHHAKVYGKAKVGAPPMSVPHLDTRYMDNEKNIAVWTVCRLLTKVLKKTGSNF